MNVRVSATGISQCVDIRLNGITLAGVLWAAAFGMLTWDTLDAHMGPVSRWALLLGMVAAVWTIELLLKHHRGVILEVMSWEHRMLYGDGSDGPEREQPQKEADNTPPMRRLVVPMQRD